MQAATYVYNLPVDPHALFPCPSTLRKALKFDRQICRKTERERTPQWLTAKPAAQVPSGWVLEVRSFLSARFDGGGENQIGAWHKLMSPIQEIP